MFRVYLECLECWALSVLSVVLLRVLSVCSVCLVAEDNLLALKRLLAIDIALVH